MEKLKKSKMTGKKILPQEFLASFTDIKDKNFIIQSQKDIVYHLCNVALNTPTDLRQNIQQTSIILGPVAVIDEPGYKEIMNFLEIKEALLNILKQYGIIKEYKLEQRYSTSTDQTFPPDDLVFADIKFYPLNIISYYEDFKKSQEQFPTKLLEGEPKFDGLNSTIRFGNKIYSFQNGRENNERLLIFKELWY